MSSRSSISALIAGIWLFSLVAAASGSARLGPYWVDVSSITMQLQLGPTNVALQDGLGTWDNSAADALALWNADLATLQFKWVKGSTVGQASRDGLNSVFFSNTAFGDDFGDDVLAITLYLTDDKNNLAEADVIVNQAYAFNSYRGPLQAKTTDIHRVLLHEFGHVLGLAHPDGPASNQMVVAIMNSTISDLDHIAQDDIDGVSALYGVKFTDFDPIFLQLGVPSSYQVETNIPAAFYSATGLPPGLTIDPTTGVISGSPSLSGNFTASITADGPGNADIDQRNFVVQKHDAGDLRASFPLQTGRMLADPGRDRVYVSLPSDNSIAVIDTANLTLLATIPVKSAPAGLAISTDGTKLYVAETGEADPEIGVIGLTSLLPLPSLPMPAPSFDLEAGLANRLYVTTSGASTGNGILQLDTKTGALLAPFPDGIPSGYLEISADHTRLYLANTDDSHLLYRFDCSTASPAILQMASDRAGKGEHFGDLKLSHDGAFLYLYTQYKVGIPKIPATDLEGTLGTFATKSSSPIALSPDDQTLFSLGGAYLGNEIDTFNTSTQKLARSLTGDADFPSAMAVDRSGQYLFVNDAYAPALEVLSTFAGIPTHPPKARRLLNVSTRLDAATGEDVLIGGFIVAGTGSKQIAVRGLGPSLPVSGALSNPLISLYDQTGRLLGSDDNWNENRSGILATGLAPKDEHEAVLLATVTPGAYTAIVQGSAGGSGIALVEVYDLTPDDDSTLGNISTRGKVETGDNVMIGGFIISPEENTEVLIRALGPTLGQSGVTDPLQDPLLELHGSDGDLIFSNDNWRATQQADIIASGLAPADDRESAIVAALEPGNYTAIVRGQGDSTGVALVEVYDLDSSASAEKALNP